MQQLDLLTIRKQPAQREPEVPHRVIKAYVKQNLRDFGRRQAERERLRREARKREKPRLKGPKVPRTTGAHSIMRSIKVTYRAVFQQPIGALNPMGAKLPGAFPVEIFQRGASWLAREIQSPRRNVYEKLLGKFASLEHAKAEVCRSFEKQMQDWQIWGTPPQDGPALSDALSIERMLTPDEICDLGNSQFGWIQAEDRTHILHGPLIDPKLKVPNAACGAQVNAKCFISTKANVEPTCKVCAEVWRKEYQTNA
jgi:hypothetical protein